MAGKAATAYTSNRRDTALNRQGYGLDIMRDAVAPCVSDLGMIELTPAQAAERAVPTREGRCFYLPRDRGTGYYWIYAERGFAVSVASVKLHRSWRQSHPRARFVSLGYLRAGAYVRQDTATMVKAPYLEGIVMKDAEQTCVLEAGQPFCSVQIMLSPLFYERHLRMIFRSEPFSVEEAFADIDGLTDFPEMTVLLAQIEAYRGFGAAARLFYRGKVEEAVALVLGKSQSPTPGEKGRGFVSLPADQLSSQDANAVERARRRLDERIACSVSAEELSRLACMGQTKLRRTFRQAYGCTIVEYRQRRRCARAAELLTFSDETVSQVAAAVGYRPERLAEVFARIYGTTPSSYRKVVRRPSPPIPAPE